MEKSPGDTLKDDFIELVRRVVNRRFNTILSSGSEIYKMRKTVSFDLVDLKSNVYVKVIDKHSSSSQRENVLNQLLYTASILQAEAAESRSWRTLIVAFRNDLDKNELEYYTESLSHLLPGQMHLFDRNYFQSYEKNKTETNEDEIEELDHLAQLTREEEVVDILGTRKIWLANHRWNEVRHIDRFIREGIFEAEPEKAFFEAAVGDVVLLHERVLVKRRRLLRIAAIGVVKENALNGVSVKVSWFVLDTYYEIAGLGRFRRAFQGLTQRLYGRVLVELSIHEPRFFDIIDALVENTKTLSIRPEMPIDLNGNIMYGQQIGAEIINYDVIFLPKSIYGGIGAEGISGYILDLLNIDRTSFDFSSTQINSFGYVWIPKQVKVKTIYFCFVISKGEDKGAADFEQSLVDAIVHFKEKFGEKVMQKIKRVFIPLLGAGQSQMNDLDSLSKVLTGVEKIREVLPTAPIRINYSRDADDEKRVALSKMVLERLNLVPGPTLAALIDARDTRKINMIPKTINDGSHGNEDLLGFETDIRVFASLMARSDLEPPFAIALFGAWGKGKSFFMSRLMRRVRELSEEGVFINDDGSVDDITTVDDQVNYCDGIAQIHFNAWSYVDSNLWAGLVSTIFERLNEYLTDHTKSQLAKLQVQEALVDKLKALNTLSKNVRGKKESFELLKKGYEQEKRNIEQRNENAFNERIWSLLKEDPKIATLHQELLNLESVSNDFIHRLDLKGLQNEVRENQRFFKLLREKKKWIPYAIVSVLCAIAAITLGHYVDEFTNGIQLLSAAICSLILPGIDAGKIGAIYQNVQQYRKRIFALEKQDQDLAVAMEEHRKMIARTDEEIRQADEQLKGLDLKIKRTEFDIQYNLIDITIADFIEGRSQHDDYTSQTGIVSTIRRDFELLSELFIERKTEQTAALEATNATTETVPIQRDLFKDQKKLQRIILYIDDLDRCTDEKVLEVLQAVHLLMAFPLFMVVVGVDKRCVNNALRYRNILQYARQTRIEKLEDLEKNFKLKIIKPNEYLEKIFQIPYHIPEASTEDIQHMIHTLMHDEMMVEEVAELESEDASPTTQAHEKATNPSISEQQETPIKDADNTTTARIHTDGVDSRTTQDMDSVASTIAHGNQTDSKEGETIEEEKIIDLRISDWELSQIQRIVPDVVGSSPRTIKRFINVYRLIRAHGEYEHEHFSLEEKLLVLFLVAIHTGCGENADTICLDIYQADTSVNLEQVLSENEDQQLLKTLKRYENEEAYRHLLAMKVPRMQDRIPMVRKFSFRERLNLNGVTIEDKEEEA